LSQSSAACASARTFSRSAPSMWSCAASGAAMATRLAAAVDSAAAAAGRVASSAARASMYRR